MNKYIPFLFLSSSLLLIVSTPVFSVDLMQIYSDATSNSLRFKSASVDYQIAEERKNEIMAEYDSELTFNITPNYSFYGNNRSSSSNKRTNNNSKRLEIDYRLKLKKPIYRKQLEYRISQADSMLEQEEAILDSEKQALITRVTSNYFGFLIAQNKLKYSLLEENTIRKNLNQLRTLYRAKQSTITDIKETESRLDQALSATAFARNELDDARKNLMIITGQHYYSLATLNTKRQFVKLEPNNFNYWIRLAHNNSHEIIAAYRKLDIQEKDIFIQKANNRTTVDLFAQYEARSILEGNSSSFFTNNDGKIGLEINVPLYQGNKVHSKVRGSHLKLKKAQYDLDFKKREVTQRVKFSFQTVMRDIENIRALQRAVLSSETALIKIRQGRTAGTRTMSNVLASLRESFQIKQKYADARYRYLLDIFALKKAAGVLSVGDIKLVNSLLGGDQDNTDYVQRFTQSENHSLNTLEEAWGLE